MTKEEVVNKARQLKEELNNLALEAARNNVYMNIDSMPVYSVNMPSHRRFAISLTENIRV